MAHVVDDAVSVEPCEGVGWALAAVVAHNGAASSVIAPEPWKPKGTEERVARPAMTCSIRVPNNATGLVPELVL